MGHCGRARDCGWDVVSLALLAVRSMKDGG